MTGNAKQIAVGGLLMAGLPGPTLDDSTRELIRAGRVNNFILFKRNADSPEQIKALTDALAATCAETGLGPPLIAIDQEGGSVARLGPPFSRFPDARQLATGPEPEAALTACARTCATELTGVGINFNLAPVLDICPAGEGFFMERRALGNDPATVARLAGLMIETMQAQGLAACGKHFPGLGAARLDPHQVLPVVEKSREELLARDLLPFLAAARAGVAAIMSSHTIYPALDPAHPATLSPLILDDLLRRDLGYQGVLITDDLEMGAIENHHSVPEAALAAFLAGADLLLICHEHDKVRATIARLEGAMAEGQISRARLGQSLARIARLRAAFARSPAG